MPDIDIVLVAPLYEGNVGFAARVMKNFGFERLVLVDPCPLGDDAFARAGHARDVLENAERCSMEEVFSRSHLAVATTGEVSKSVNTAMRMPFYTPAELRDIIKDARGRVSILFGRENWGLSNPEVQRCGIVCTIPTDPAYPILNISHAVGIACYELAGIPRGTYPLASPKEMECLERHIERFLDRIDHPDFKRENTMILLRRLIQRTMPTIREVSVLHGLMRRAEWHMKK
ncbi:MAG: RNA methyltransferase [Methanomicrobiales archaeon]